MPVFAFTVGSIGDIQGIAGLIIRIGMVLYNAHNTSQDYKDLMKELGSIHSLVEQVDNIKKIAIAPKTSIDALSNAITDCEKCMEDFLYERAAQTLWKKVTWAISGSTEAATLRRSLYMHQQRIQTALSCVMYLDNKQRQEASDMMMKDMYSIVRHGVDTFCLVDIYGTENFIRLEDCPTFKMLNGFIKLYAENQRIPGEVYVDRDKYRLVPSSGKEFITASNWKRFVKPGAKVEMSVVLRWVLPPTTPFDRCPRCYTLHKPGAEPWINCRKCLALFQVEDQTASDGSDMELISPASQTGHTSGDFIEMTERLQGDSRKELRRFHRILVVVRDLIALSDGY